MIDGLGRLDQSTVQSPYGLLAPPQCLMPGSPPQPAQASRFLFMMPFRLVVWINKLNSDSDLRDFPFTICHTGSSLCLHEKKCICFNFSILGNRRLPCSFLVHREARETGVMASAAAFLKHGPCCTFWRQPHLSTANTK